MIMEDNGMYRTLLHFPFWAEVDQIAFSEAIHCNLTFYIQCVEMLIFYIGHADTLMTNSSRCCWVFFISISHGAIDETLLFHFNTND